VERQGLGRARVASAPGRVNLLGEHLDRQGGTVLPVAIALRTTVRHLPGGAWDFRTDGAVDASWTRYPRAVVAALEAAGELPVPGRVEIKSDLPCGRGLGSSAALGLALASALSDRDPFSLALLCRRAENEGVGVACGLMDQAASACARAGQILVLDCAAETYRLLPLPDVELFVFDSGIERTLASTPYTDRLQEAARRGTPAARHLAEEKARVAEGIALLERGEIARFGNRLYDSHASLRDGYRCSHPRLDAFVERCRSLPGVLGARLTGAGWGGCCVALVRPGTDVPGARRLATADGVRRGG